MDELVITNIIRETNSIFLENSSILDDWRRPLLIYIVADTTGLHVGDKVKLTLVKIEDENASERTD